MSKLKVLIVTAIITMAMSLTAFAGEWRQDSVGWWYQNDDGSYPQNAWLQDNGKWYHFDDKGYMQTGWIEESYEHYYLNADGTMQTSSITLNGVTYNFNPDGSCQNPYAEAAKENFYDDTTGTEKNLGAELTEAEIIARITGGGF